LVPVKSELKFAGRAFVDELDDIVASAEAAASTAAIVIAALSTDAANRETMVPGRPLGADR
jgi:hypothetical protein